MAFSRCAQAARSAVAHQDEDCGAPRACVRFCKGSLAAPRYGDILGPDATLISGAFTSQSEVKDWTRHVPGRAVGERRTPEAGPLPAGRFPGLLHPKGLGPILSAGTSGAAPLIPRSRRSAARVLMDEGCMHFTASSSTGDNIATTRR